jgi:hypothetical protein
VHAVLAAKIVATDPEELWRLGWLVVPVHSSGVALGVGAHGFRAWRARRRST